MTSGQGGGIGRYTLPPRTTKRRTTTNLKTKNNQNYQKIELYGSPTTKELNKKFSSRLVGGAKMGSQGKEDAWQGGSWRTEVGELVYGGLEWAQGLVDQVVPHSHVDKPGGTTREQDRPHN